MTQASLHFDRFELQPHERRLLDAGRPVPMGARAFDVLCTLAARAGHLVTKAELMDEVWPGLVVEENNLAAQVSALRKVLGGEIIATIPGRGYRFTAVPQIHVEARDQPVVRPVAAAEPIPAPRTTSAPVGPRLFGRDADLVRLTAQLEAPGCVTLVGAAGVGKTRLAQAVAARWDGRFIWVDLAALAKPNELFAALGRSLDVQLPDDNAEPALARALRGDRVLVVLDNAEHVVDAAAAVVAAIERAGPHVSILVTSQLPLALPGERVDRLEPLALDAQAGPGSPALADGAVALLVDRIVAADHRFQASPETLPLLREICMRLDGMPLALEMAAARVPLLGLQNVRDALSERFALLTTGHRGAPGRHKTLHAALDWSHGLLSADEQRLFRSLGVFSGGFTLDLVAAVAGGDGTDRWSIIDRLAVLVDRSLVAADHADPPRYRLLETMRAYALEKLQAAGEEANVRRRHARVLKDLFQRVEMSAGTAENARLRVQGHAEFDNARDAIAWAIRNEPATALPLATYVAMTATFTIWRKAALAWITACEPVADAVTDAPVRAYWTYEYARQLLMSARPGAVPMARRARDVFRALGDDLNLFRTTAVIVRGLHEAGAELDASCSELQALLERHPEWPIARRMLAEGAFALASEQRGDLHGRLTHRLAELELARQARSTEQADAAESNVVTALYDVGRVDEALARSAALMQRIGDNGSGNAAYGWVSRLGLLVAAGKIETARTEMPRALAIVKQFDLPNLSEVLSDFAVREGRVRAAARLIGYSRQAYAARSVEIDKAALERLAAAETVVRSRLDEPTVTRLIEEGRLLDDEAADRVVLGTDDM